MSHRTKNSRTISSSGNQGKYDVYLVGFPHAQPRPPGSNLLPHEIYPADWVHLISHIAPEANVFDFVIFPETISLAGSDTSGKPIPQDGAANQGIGAEDGSGCHGDTTDRCCSAEGLQNEARLLLDIAKEPDPTSMESEWRPIIFAGYQLGGLVVQQAMVICNTDPKYHDIALRTHELVIVGAPRHECDLATWESILDTMILSSNIEIKGRKSAVMGELAASVHEAVAYFQGALNYPVVYLPYDVEPDSKTPSAHGVPLTFHLGTPNTARLDAGSQKGQISESELRTLLFPQTLLKDYFWDAEPRDARLFYSDLLDFMQILSPTTQLIHRSAAWQMMGEDLALESYTHSAIPQPLNQRFIWIIGPPGYGKATLVKFIARKVMRDIRKGFLLDLGLEPFELADFDVPVLLRLFIHQIVSQRPGLFSQIRPLYLERYNKDEVTSIEPLWTFLHILLHASDGWKVVLATANIHLSSEAVRSSLGKIERLLKSLKLDYFVVSSSPEMVTLPGTSDYSLVLDLGLNNIHRTSPIQTTFKKVLFAQPAIRRLKLPAPFRDLQIPEFVSVAHAVRYAVLLSRSFLLSTPEAVDVAIRDCPRTEARIFNYCIQSLDIRLRRWCSMVISWVYRSIRPLRTEELAVAIALCGEPLKMAELAPRISRSLESDIRRYLDLVLRVDNNLVYFHSANTKEFLDEQTSEDEPGRELKVLDHGQIVSYCVQYMTNIFSGKSESAYAAQVSWRGHLQDHDKQHEELEFLDYVVRHWPTHYRAYIKSNLETQAQDSQSQYSNCSSLKSQIETDDVHNRVLAFLSNDTVRNRWYQLYRSKKVPFNESVANISALEVATELGFAFLVNILLPDSTRELSNSTLPMSDVSLDLSLLLVIAIRHNHSPLVEMFVKKGARRDTAFLTAAGLGYVDYLESLYDSERLNRDTGNFLESVLHQAARGGSLSCVEYCAKKAIDWSWKDSEGSSIIHAAAIGGKVEILESVTKGRNLDINSQDNNRRSPLMIATQLNHALFVEKLCKTGADPTISDKDGKTALHLAITRDPTIVKALLEINASPVSPDLKNQTPLHYACALGNNDIVSQLVAAIGTKESIDIRNNDKKTPLDIAAACGNKALVSLLLQHGANPSVEVDNHQGSISLAASGGHLDVFEELYSHSHLGINESSREALIMRSASMGRLLIVRFLLGKVANVNFHLEGESPLAVASSKGYTEIVRLLLNHGADPNLLDESGLSPLYRAVEGGHACVVDVLLTFKADLNADPNALNREMWTPLHCAASRDMIEIVEVLLKNGANVNARTIVKTTPLHLAVAYPEVVETLLKYKPDLAASAYSGETPLHLAVAGHHIRTVELLVKENDKLAHITRRGNITAVHVSIEKNPGDTVIFELLCPDGKLDSSQECYQVTPPLIYALKCSNLHVTRFLLERRPEMAVLRDPDGVSTLHMAAQTGNVDVVDELLQAFRELDINGRTCTGETPLHFASTALDDEMTRKLVDFGAEVNVVDNEGRTPLYKAAWTNKLSTVKSLLDAKADTNLCTTTSTWSPLHAAADSAPVIEALLTHGADIEYADRVDGWTALLRAAYWESSQGLEMLLKWNANVQAVNMDGQTALHLTEKEGEPILSQILLNAKANVNAVDNTGKTPLHYTTAYAQGDKGAVKIQQLLAFGANACATDSEGNTPLHYAAALTPDAPELIEVLIEAIQQRNLSIDTKNNNEQTPLHMSLSSGTFDQFKRLFDKGASLRERDAEGNSCLALASSGPDSKKKVQCILAAKIGHETLSSPWTLKDKTASFQVASKIDRDTALVIAEYDNQIFQVEDDAFTVLRLCLDSGQRDIAEKFLQLGASPFRHKAGQPSVFQYANAIYGRNPFVMACLKQLDRDEPDQLGLFQVLRISGEEHWSDLSCIVPGLDTKFTETQITDHDGWGIHHFNFQHQISPDGSTTAVEGMPATKSATRFTIPEHWAGEDHPRRSNIFSDDGHVHYRGGSSLSPSKMSIRSDHPFPPRLAGSNKQYFEVEIIPEIIPEIDARDGLAVIVGVGLCGEFVDMNNGFPGWWTHAPSMGYHGDLGWLFSSSGSDDDAIRTGKTFAEGDTVGCGVDWGRGSVYYTLNGEIIGREETSLIYRKLYPMVTAMGKACKLKANFGDSKFRFVA